MVFLRPAEKSDDGERGRFEQFAEHALQRKRDAIAMALLEEREDGKGADKAREGLLAAIRVEERHW